MFREIKLKDRAINTQTAIDIVKKGSFGVLSTIGEDGYPYGVPLNYTFFDDCLCFHCALEGHKLENINFNEKVSFCVITQSDVLGNEFDTNYESAVAFGKAAEVTNDQEKNEIFLSLLNKYSAGYIKAGKNYIKKYWKATRVIKIKIDHLSAKANK